MDLRDQLITILQDKHMGIGAVPNIAEAISADARFSIWLLTHAKEQASEDQMFELLDRYEAFVERGSVIARTFNENHDLGILMADIDRLTKDLTEATKLP
jgi:hypothetical protein